MLNGFTFLTLQICGHFNASMEFLLLGVTPENKVLETTTTTLLPAQVGKITLENSTMEPGDYVYEGSVFIDGQPVCDNQWDRNDALVVCRWNIMGFED